MYINLNTDKNEVKNKLKKDIKEAQVFIKLLREVIKGTEKIKHHKQVTRKINSSINANVYLYNDRGLSSQRLNVRFDQKERIYRQYRKEGEDYDTCIYFDNVETSIYFKTYLELIENAEKQIDFYALKIVKLQAEIKKITSIINKAYKATEAVKTLDNELSQSMKQAINWKF